MVSINVIKNPKFQFIFVVILLLLLFGMYFNVTPFSQQQKTNTTLLKHSPKLSDEVKLNIIKRNEIFNDKENELKLKQKREKIESIISPICTDIHSKQVSKVIEIPSLNVSNPSDKNGFCKPYRYAQLKTTPPIDMCIWPEGSDMFISERIAAGGIWDATEMEYTRKCLQNQPPGIVIDAGANIGQFALFMAALGHYVYAIEPFGPHIEMIQKSRLMNGFNNLRIYKNAISDHHGIVQLLGTDDKNRGGGFIRKLNFFESDIHMIKLDDLIPLLKKNHPKEKAILFMKIDIEGHEARLFRGAIHLLSEYNVKNIVMEISHQGFRQAGCDVRMTLKAMMQLGYKIITKEVGELNQENFEHWMRLITQFNTVDIMLEKITNFS